MTETLPSLSAAKLKSYRARTYRYAPGLKLKNERDAVGFVDERGFIYFWPIRGVELPSLWGGVAGDRPVADAHDDPGHVTWGWKDRMLSEKQWYYGKLLRGKATLVSLPVLPYFYALSENYGEPDSDYVIQYEEGRLTQEARLIFEALLEKGPTDTVALRKLARMAGRDSNARFERALTELQTGLKILPVGVAQAGAWRYSFIYQIVDRHFPDLAERARPIGRGEARIRLADLLLKSVGAATERQVAQLFRWKPEEAHRTIEGLVQQGKARPAARVGGEAGRWLVTPDLLNS